MLAVFIGYLATPLKTSLSNTAFLTEMSWLEVQEAINTFKDGV
tara:strand:+ start:199 stop:327 length:129 start_codon:yes stop_codon:yes gene_type:complete